MEKQQRSPLIQNLVRSSAIHEVLPYLDPRLLIKLQRISKRFYSWLIPASMREDFIRIGHNAFYIIDQNGDNLYSFNIELKDIKAKRL
jgi:hypothetical protein